MGTEAHNSFRRFMEGRQIARKECEKSMLPVKSLHDSNEFQWPSMNDPCTQDLFKMTSPDNFFQNRNSLFQNQMSMSQTSTVRQSAAVKINVTRQITKKSRKIVRVNGEIVEQEEVDETVDPVTHQFSAESNRIFTNDRLVEGLTTFSRNSFTTDDERSCIMNGESSLNTNMEQLAIKDTSEETKRKSFLNKFNFIKPKKPKKTEIDTSTKLGMIIKELMNTEENYVKDLGIVVDEYMTELNRLDFPRDLKDCKEKIFGNVEHIYMFHDVQFKTDLNEADKTPEGIANCFLKHKKEFYLYRHYNRNKPYTEKYLDQYGHFFEKKQFELNDTMGIKAFLIKPTQRIVRYILLLKDLAKEAKKNKLSDKEVNEAISMLETEIKFGNDLMALDAIRGLPGNLDLKAQGDLIYRDKFVVTPAEKGSNYEAMVFLFKEMIVITDVQLEDNIDKHYYKDHICLKDVGLTECEKEPKIFRIWYLKYNKKTYKLQTSPEVKKLWVQRIREQLVEELKMKAESKKNNTQDQKLIDLSQRKFMASLKKHDTKRK